MAFHKDQRKDHNLRAERLEARFSPTWTGEGSAPTTPIIGANPPASPPPPASPNPPAPPPARPVPPAVPPPSNPTSTVPAPAALPTTTPAVAPLPLTSTPSTTSSVVPTTVVTPSASSTTSIVQTTPTPVATTPTTTASRLSTPSAFRSLPSAVSFTTVSSASPTATAAASKGMGTGGIVGIAAGSIAGVAIVGVLGIWVLKRYFQSRNNDDPSGGFQRHSWMRNSLALADDAPSPIYRGPNVDPRPPTMIERKQTVNYSNVPASRGGYPQHDNGGMAYSDYQTSPYGAHGMPSFSPGQHFSTPSPHSAQTFFSPISSPPPPPGSPGMASFDDTAPIVQHASYGAVGTPPVYFSRHDSNLSAAQPDSAVFPNPHDNVPPAADGYATLDRSSVTPYQAQQYAEISKQLQDSQGLAAVPEVEDDHATGGHANGPSPFEDPVHEQYQDLAPPSPAHPRVGSTPPMLPPMRSMSPVGPVGAHASFAQIANAFPAAPISPVHPAFPPPVAGSPKTSTFSQSPPLSPGIGPQKGHVVSVPESVHVVRETPVQFGFNDPGQSEEPKAVRRVSLKPSANPNRLSIASKRSVPKSGRPETMYDEEDAYGGI